MKTRLQNPKYLLIPVLILITAVAGRLYGHNVICGISVGVETTMPALKTVPALKWSSDSHALAGIAAFYEGISNIQLVEIDNLRIAETKNTEVKKIQEGESKFKEAAKHFGAAIAEGEKLLDTISDQDAKAKGTASLERYRMLQHQIEELISSIDSRRLPPLSKFHEAIDVTLEIITFGRDMSKSHAKMASHLGATETLSW